MGLFYRSDRPGKGVEKEEMEKNRFFVFFDVFFRKFMRFVQLNVLYLLFCIPYFILLYFFSPLNTYLLTVTDLAGIGGFIQSMPAVDAEAFDILLRSMFALAVLIFWGAGPVSAGTAYVLRNFAREEHAWVWSDFFEQLKSNFKQGIVVLLVDLLVLYLSMVAFQFYGAAYAASANTMMLIAEGLLVVFLILYTFMHYYIYPMMVSFDLKIGKLYRNAFLFAIAKFPQNVFFTLICLVILIALFSFISLFAWLVFAIFLTIFLVFVLQFYTTHVVDQNMLE